ncbi:MAG: hypothetical protein FWE91_05975 [Defluviitaleaceae bacterium]|nr:hypothetical protein [Defluviitaleaceae bacterium]MCL2835380.1 hypothetical protein [Defluviitaleaceae bacterium]
MIKIKRRTIRRGIALLLGILFAVPVWMAQPPLDLHAFDSTRVGFNSLGRTLRESGISGGRIPEYIPLGTSIENAFSFDLVVPPEEDIYVIFPLTDGMVVRLDFRRSFLSNGGDPNKMRFEYTSYNTISSARTRNNERSAEFSIYNLAGNNTIPYDAVDPNDTYDLLGLDITPGLVYPNVLLDTSNANGFSFQVKRDGIHQTIYDALTTYHLLWNPQNDTVSFGVNAHQASAQGLLKNGIIYTFEFGRLVPGNINAVHPNPFFYHIINGVNSGDVESQPFSQDFAYVVPAVPHQNLSDRFVYDFVHNVPPENQASRKWFDTFGTNGVVNADPHVHLRRDNNGAVSWFENWADTQRARVTIPLPYAWRDSGGPGGGGRFNYSLWDIQNLKWVGTGFETNLPMVGGVRNSVLLDMSISFHLDTVIPPHAPPGTTITDYQLSANNIFRFGLLRDVNVNGQDIRIIDVTGGLGIVFDPFQLAAEPATLNMIRYHTDTNSIEIVLDGLAASTVYNGASISITGGMPGSITDLPAPSFSAEAAGSATPIGDKVRTFLGYTYPEFLDSIYVVWVTPYRYFRTQQAITGDYTIFRYVGEFGLQGNPTTNMVPPDAVTVRMWNTTNLIAFEIPISGSYPVSFHRVTFDPYGRLWESRPFRLIPEDGDVKIGMPRNFDFWEYMGNKHRLLPINQDISELTLYLEWDIAETSLIDQQLRRIVPRDPSDPSGNTLLPPLNTAVSKETAQLTTMSVRYDLNSEMGAGVDDRAYGYVEIVLGLYRWTDANGNLQEVIDIVTSPTHNGNVYENGVPVHQNGSHVLPVPPNFTGFDTFSKTAALNPNTAPFSFFELLGQTETDLMPKVNAVTTPGGQTSLQIAVRTRAVSLDSNMSAAAKNQYVFSYPNIFFLNVTTSQSQRNYTFPTDPPMTDTLVAPNRKSINRLLVLDDFDISHIMPPQEFLLRPKDFPLNDDDNPVTLEMSFRAPYAELREFVEQFYTRRRDDMFPSGTVGGATASRPYVPVATFSLVISQSEELMMRFGNFLREHASNNPEAPLPPQMPAVYSDTGAVISPAEPIWYYTAMRNPGNPGALPTPVLPVYSFDIAVNMLGQAKPIRDILREGGVVVVADFPWDEHHLRTNVTYNPQRDRWLGEMDAGNSVRYPNPSLFYEMFAFDRNQKYYSAMFTELSLHHPFNPFTNDILRFYSNLTGIIAITTDGETDSVDPDEIPPGRPEWVRPIDPDGITDTTSTLHWTAPEMIEDNYTVRYEVVRTMTPVVPEALNFLGSLEEFMDLFTVNESGRVSYFINQRGTHPLISGPLPSYTAEPQSGFTRLYTLDDEYLLPNNIYYYYVRAVKFRNFGEHEEPVRVSSSVWDAISLTTNVVDGPRNLRILRDQENHPYDPLTEAVIQFEVLNGAAGFFWDLELSEAGSPWFPYWAGRRQLPRGEDLGNGWTLITYKITGLNASTDYSFRVRLVDLGDQPSMWTDPVFYRTEFDQDDYDIRHDINSWINFLRLNLWDEFNKPYWPLDKSASTALVLYRHAHSDSLVQSTVDAQLYIYSEPVDRLDILLPVSLIEAANRNNKSLIIRNGRFETIIPPNALTDALDGVTSARHDMARGDAGDYYVMFSVHYTKLSHNPVDGNELGGPQADIRAQAMASRITAKSLDDEILRIITAELESEELYEDARRVIRSMLEQNRPNDEIALYVYGYLDATKNRLMLDARTRYVESSYRSYPIMSFARPVQHALLTDSAADIITGYVAYTGSFAHSQASPYKTGMAVLLNGPASVIFTLFNALTGIPGLVETVDYPGDMASVIAKYGLADLVGTDLTITASLSAVMTIAARISGAPAGTDGINYFRNNGYSITGKTGSSSVSKQEAAYVIMALYELRTGISADSMQIRNFAATAGIQGIDDRYLRSVQAAFELDIFTENDWNPRETLSMMELLNMLSRLNSKLGL